MNGTIALEGLEFHAFHGVYPHEQKSGNYFVVDLSVETDFSDAAGADDLAGTIDYEILFQIIKTEMNKPSKLLESVAIRIASAIFNKLHKASSVTLKIAKRNPPIGGKCDKAVVSLCLYRNNETQNINSV